MIQATIGALRVSLGIDTAEFQAGAKRAQSTLGGLTSSLKAFAAGAVGALSLGAVVQGLRSATDHMDTLAKSAQKIGIPVAELSKLEYAARLSDISLGDLESTLARFSKSLGDIAGGGENDAGAALRALGISATDASGRIRPTIDLMSDIAEEFAVMQDGAGKTAIAIALFGRSGASMIPLLNGGREAIAGAGEELRQFGGVVSEEAAVAAEEFNDNLTRLKTAAEGVSTQVATALLPGMVSLTDAMVDFAKEGTIAQQVADAISFVMTEAAKGAIFLSQAWTEIAELATFLADAFARLANGDFEGMSEAWAASQERVRVALEKNLALIQQIDGSGQTVAGGKGDLPSSKRVVPAPILPSSSGSSRKSSSSKSSITPITGYDIRGIGLEMTNLTEVVKESDKAMTEWAANLGGSVASGLVSIARSATSMKDALSQLKEMAQNALWSISESLLTSGLNGLLGAAGTQFGGAMGFGGFGGFYADGGRLGAGKWGIAGEAGPEIIHGPANITPMDGGRGGRVQVTNINNSSASVSTRESTGADGSINIETIIEDKVIDVAGGGRFAKVMGGRYGSRVKPRRQ
jgi:hypothetical protein